MEYNALMRKLPIGIQTFEKLRKENYLYVDKTEFVWKMAFASNPYFLSRPRRFGKSLLLSTFEAYFEGKKELFEGLAIEKMETEWKKYPVLHLDLNAEKYDSPERLGDILSNQLTQWELKYGKGVDENTLSTRFSGIIRRACEQAGCGVVVLVDEYDKPLHASPRQRCLAGRLPQDPESLLRRTEKCRPLLALCLPYRSHEILASQRIQ